MPPLMLHHRVLYVSTFLECNLVIHWGSALLQTDHGPRPTTVPESRLLDCQIDSQCVVQPGKTQFVVFLILYAHDTHVKQRAASTVGALYRLE